MKRELRMIVGSIAFAVLSIPTMAFAAPWPITPHSKLVYGPGPWGLNTFCGVQFDGSFSAAYFSQAQSWVNYGGNCNAQWGRPANTLRSRVRAWDDVSGTLTQTTGYVFNAHDAHTAHAQITRNAWEHYIIAETGFLPTGSWTTWADGHVID